MRKFLIVLLVLHTAMTFYFLQDDGFWSVFPPFKEGYTWQIFSDLVVSISVVLFFIYRESEKQKIQRLNFYLLFLATAFLGSFAPLGYMIYQKNLFANS